MYIPTDDGSRLVTRPSVDGTVRRRFGRVLVLSAFTTHRPSVQVLCPMPRRSRPVDVSLERAKKRRRSDARAAERGRRDGDWGDRARGRVALDDECERECDERTRGANDDEVRAR